jgi:hypothetical protein
MEMIKKIEKNLVLISSKNTIGYEYFGRLKILNLDNANKPAYFYFLTSKHHGKK